MLPTIATTRLGKAIRMKRKGLDLGQVQFCALANVGTPFLHMLEHGKPTVRMDKLLAVLDVLGLGLHHCESRGPLEVPGMGDEVHD